MAVPIAPSPARRWLILLAVLVLLAAGGYGLFRLAQTTDYSELHREGPAAMVEHNEARQLWVLVKYEERRHLGLRDRGGRFGTRYHLELRCHDSQSGRKLWTRRLISLGERQDGHGAQARILGQDGELVWLFVDDQPVAVAAADGSVRATGIDITAKNPDLVSLVPTELDFYTFDRGLVFIAADGQRRRITLPGYAATPYVTDNEDAFQRRKFMSTRWHGGYDMRDFMTPQARPDAQRWYGLFTAKEAEEAGQDGFGSNLKDPDRTWGRDTEARRAFHTARIGRTKVFSEGSHERLFDVTRLPQSAAYLQGGLLREAGRKTPLMPGGTDLLVLHRTRIDAQGRAALARVRIGTGNSVQTVWTRPLPFAELHSRWQMSEHLLMIGNVQLELDGRTRFHEFITVLDVRDGSVRGWNLSTDQPWPDAGLPPRPGS